jgi:uncharacterized protein YjbI with pentapeptide repeats
MSEEPRRPSGDDPDAWKAYWEAQGMPWRTEPEIDQERQRFLAECRTIMPNIEQGIYPFKDIRLARADVEWLLATHASGGMCGPVDWTDESQRARAGLDFRGANLRGADLHALPLACIRAGLTIAEWSNWPTEHSDMAAADFTDANLRAAQMQGATFLRAHLTSAKLRGAKLLAATLLGAELRGAILASASLQHADLRRAHLEETDLTQVRVQSADLRGAFFDPATVLNGITLSDQEVGTARLADVRWGGVNLAVVKWTEPVRQGLFILGPCPRALGLHGDTWHAGAGRRRRL